MLYITNAVVYVISLLLDIYIWIIIARALISWVNPDPYNPIVSFLYRATEPVLSRVRRFIPDLGGIDLSPLIVIFIIYLIKQLIVRLLYTMAF